MDSEHNYKTLENYRAMESSLHRDLMQCSRKYLNHLGIISIVGIIDIVKSEIIELEKATSKNITNDAANNHETEIQNTY